MYIVVSYSIVTHTCLLIAVNLGSSKSFVIAVYWGNKGEVSISSTSLRTIN